MGRLDEAEHETTEATTCSALSEALDEPLAGTAARASSWLCLEQPGPWGRDAVLQSHLDSEVGAALSARAEAAGVRVQLIRGPGRHPDADRPRRVYLAHTRPERSWLRTRAVNDPAELLELDFDRIARGHHDSWGEAVNDPVLLVCTNGRRDRCCAVWGRALVTELAGRYDGLWETTHTGGHRFAPACVLLPSGYTYGRITTHQAESVLSAAFAGKIVTEGCRGRSCWSGAGQAAELAVREFTGEYLGDALSVEEPPAESGQVRVTHRDGRRWTVTVRSHELEPPRPSSCGKSSARPTCRTAEQVSPLD